MQLIDIVRVLRNAIPKTRTFNVFTAIGCESNEVFLHSRLIAALINPRLHQYGEEALRSLLQHLGIPLEGELGYTAIYVRYLRQAPYLRTIRNPPHLLH